MKNSIIFLFTVLSVILFSCENNEVQTSQPQKTTPQCHTELVEEPLWNSIVAKEVTIATGQFVNGIVKDHAKNNPGYTKEMFLLDNPLIAKRNLVKKLDPCDPTKIKYVSLPLYQGDVILLRLPFRLDTLQGKSESVVWKSPTGPNHIKCVVDMVSGDRLVTELQNIDCENNFQSSPCPPNNDPAYPPSTLPTGWPIDTPWWVWLVLAILLLIAFLLWKSSNKDYKPETLIKTIHEEGEKTRHHVSEQAEKTRHHTSDQNEKTRHYVNAGNQEVKNHMTQETREMRMDIANQMNNVSSGIQETNKLLKKILENGQPK